MTGFLYKVTHTETNLKLLVFVENYNFYAVRMVLVAALKES